MRPIHTRSDPVITSSLEGNLLVAIERTVSAYKAQVTAIKHHVSGRKLLGGHAQQFPTTHIKASAAGTRPQSKHTYPTFKR
ncbi:hypothetical protein KDA_69110 [Dictyobacter alpinus]|uniref:Uncharacterized protein n=1 Tax=Dictyobacter alpinus TaxID=2014873 RepID=A0A402BJA3_9CHLR|nr:hypothetical protein KDA_69110 [Dictyobacter alpinus]